MAKLVLSVSGGGAHGAMACAVLDEVSQMLGARIAEKFDLFAGSSTGAIIVNGLLARKDVTAQGMLDFYRQKAPEIFDKSCYDEVFGWFQRGPKYDGKSKTAIFQKHFGAALFGDLGKPSVITAYELHTHTGVTWENWNSNHAELPLAALVDASSAAPLFFPPRPVGSHWYADGGINHNHPADTAADNARALWPGEQIKVLSIGTGHDLRPLDGIKAETYGPVEWLQNGLISMLRNNSHITHKCQEILGIENFLHIDEILPQHIDAAMDNTEPEQLDALEKFGRHLARKNEAGIKDIFGEKRIFPGHSWDPSSGHTA